jgi:hypothetical protein
VPKIVVLEQGMTSTNQSFTHLSDGELLATVTRLATSECRATVALVRSLMELDVRRLYLGEGYSSLFTYCTQALHLAEGAAYNRIEAARAARRFPAILTVLEEGAVTLTTIRLVAPHLTMANHQDVLAGARHKGKREVEALVASLRPLPSVPSTIRKLPETRQAPLDTKPVLLTSTTAEPSPPVRAIAMVSRPMETPLAPERYKLQFTISGETHAKLRQVQAIGRHVVPSGDPAEIFDRALTLLLQDLERRRCAAVTSPRPASTTVGRSRHIPASVKRDVWRRDEGRCAYIGREGRCTERGFLEYHHVQPYAAGGLATTANIELRCRAHNEYEASLFFGCESDRTEDRPPTSPAAIESSRPTHSLGVACAHVATNTSSADYRVL